MNKLILVALLLLFAGCEATAKEPTFSCGKADASWCVYNEDIPTLGLPPLLSSKDYMIRSDDLTCACIFKEEEK